MANKKYDDSEGVWRTIGGRRVFIRTGQSLSDAMKESGKFKSSKKENNVEKNEDKKELTDKEINSLQHQARKVRSQVENGEFANEREREKLWKEFDDINEKLGKDRIDLTLQQRMEMQGNNKAKEKTNSEQFEVGDLKKKALDTLPKEDIDSHEGDLYIKKTKESEALLNNMKNKDSGLLSTFKDQQTGETWYDVPFANMEDDYKAKSNELMNEKIRAKSSKKSSEPDLPKHTEIKEQGNSNRKEVSENIQAHILDYYTEDYTGEDISPQDAFIRQMDAMGEPNLWRAGQHIAEGGSYLIYNGDMADFLDSLKINPKGKTFSEDKAFDMYTNLIGRESAKLYDRIKRNAYNEYKKEHPLTRMTFEEFKNMKK